MQTQSMMTTEIRATKLPLFDYDRRVHRYRDRSSGRFVAWREVRTQLDRVYDGLSDRMENLTRKLIANEIDVGDWLVGMADELKTAHVISRVIAVGGIERMTPSDWGAIGRQLREEYQFLGRFALQIIEGKQKLNGSAVMRSRMYAQAARSFYEDSQRDAHAAVGYTHERRVRHAQESCDDCIEYESRGWQPIGTLPTIGDSKCKTNCRCTFEYR